MLFIAFDDQLGPLHLQSATVTAVRVHAIAEDIRTGATNGMVRDFEGGIVGEWFVNGDLREALHALVRVDTKASA